MISTPESRIEQRAASLRERFDRRVALTSFAGCFVVTGAYFLWLDPNSLARLTRPGAFAFTLLGVPAVSLVGFFLLRVLMNPFLDGYYTLLRRKWHEDIALSEVLAEELAARATGYLDAAQELLRKKQPSPILVEPVAHRAFQRLVEADELREALELGERLGLPAHVTNQARRRMLANWENTDPESPRALELREKAAKALAESESIDGLARTMASGEASPTTTAIELARSYAKRLDPLLEVPGEALHKLLPAATVLRLAQLHTLLAQAFLAAGDRYASRCQLERAIDLNPRDARTRVMLSRLHYDQQNYPLALAVIEAHLDKFPDDQVARFHMEDCIRALGRK